MPQPILLYDGVCGLCNRLVQFILRRDHGAVFQFASLQSHFAAEILARHGVDPADLDTVYVVVNHRPSRTNRCVRAPTPFASSSANSAPSGVSRAACCRGFHARFATRDTASLPTTAIVSSGATTFAPSRAKTSATVSSIFRVRTRRRQHTSEAKALSHLGSAES